MSKMLLIGHARHGKDTAAQFLKDLYGYNFESSSVAASRIFLYEALKNKYKYKNAAECFDDRVNHRKEWHDMITAYNKSDKTRLARDILKNNDIYVGMRSYKEINACKEAGLFSLIIGVFDPRKPLEPKSSFNIDLWKESDVIIPNAGTLNDLKAKLRKCFSK